MNAQTNNAAGDLTLGAVTAQKITAVNHNLGGDVVLNGQLTASGSGSLRVKRN